ncbi:29754_t:CDS:1, partial [Racocetra persica]
NNQRKNTDSRLFIRQRRNTARLEVIDIYRDYHVIKPAKNPKLKILFLDKSEIPTNKNTQNTIVIVLFNKKYNDKHNP